MARGGSPVVPACRLPAHVSEGIRRALIAVILLGTSHNVTEAPLSGNTGSVTGDDDLNIEPNPDDLDLSRTDMPDESDQPDDIGASGDSADDPIGDSDSGADTSGADDNRPATIELNGGPEFCFQCASQYVAGTLICPECGVGLVNDKPMPVASVGADDEEQLAYELHEWAFESRRMVDQVLTNDGVEHAWQGAVLIVRDADEARVDAVVDAIERTTLPTLDADAPKEVYEMEGWDSAQQSELSSRLGLAGIAHTFNVDGDLVVQLADEEAVEAIFDALLDEIELADEDDTELVALEGLDANRLMSNLFESATRLAKDARDYRGVEGITEHGQTMAVSKRPFGLDSATWAGITALVTTIRTELENEGDDEIISEAAATLRDTLRSMI